MYLGIQIVSLISHVNKTLQRITHHSSYFKNQISPLRPRPGVKKEREDTDTDTDTLFTKCKDHQDFVLECGITYKHKPATRQVYASPSYKILKNHTSMSSIDRNLRHSTPSSSSLDAATPRFPLFIIVIKDRRHTRKWKGRYKKTETNRRRYILGGGGGGGGGGVWDPGNPPAPPSPQVRPWESFDLEHF